jgi:hypothetical protein
MSSTEPITGTYQPLSGQPGYSLIENPPFHPNILNIPMRQLSATQLSPDFELYRGLMSTRVSQNVSAQGTQQYRVNFLYNPASIDESRTLDLNNNVLPSYARKPDDPGQYKTGLNATVSFSLLFDRTFEMWDSSYADTDAAKYGITTDVNALYNMLNINQLNTQTPVSLSSGDFASTQQYALVVQGTMAAIPVDLYFGYKSPGALKYFGYVSQFDVTYTHFSQKMVPMRCAIQIGFTLMSDLFTSSSQ